MTETKPNLLPIIGGAAVVVAGGIGAYFFLNKPAILPTGSSTAGTLAVVPKRSLMAISMSTDSAALSKIEQFLSPETKKLYDKVFADVKKGLAAGDFDYEKDVKPWIGKSVTIAILPSGKTASLLPSKSQAAIQNRYVPMSDTGSIQFVQDKDAPKAKAEPNVLIVIEVKDKVGAEKFLTDKVKAKTGGKETKSDYKGVQITQYGEGPKAGRVAMVGDYLVVGPNEQDVKTAIDTSKGEASLASGASADDLKLQNPVIQFYIPNFGESIVELAALNPEAKTIPPESMEQLKKVKSMNMGFGIDDVGIRFKAVGKFDPAAIAALKNSPNKVISQIPSQAFAVTNGFSIKNSWEQFVKSADNTPEVKKGIDEVRTQLKSSPVPLDLDKDIFGWMDGEFAFAVVSGKPEGILAQSQGLAPLLMLQTTNRAAAESLFKKVDDFASKNGVKVSKKDVGGVSVTEWSVTGAGAIGSYGWSQQDTLFITASPIVSLFVPKPATAIDADPTFKSVVSTLPANNIGYFYIDADRTWSIVQSFMPPAEKEKTPPEAKALIESIRGLAGTAVYPNADTAEVEVILALKKGGK
jgi:Protein of unknown function (DUF3352)